MSESRKIREKIREIAGSNGIAHFTAYVTKVSDSDCTIKIGDLEIEHVKLFSIDTKGSLTIKPKVNTVVTVADLSDGQLRDLTLVKVDIPETIKYSENGLEVEIDSVEKKIDIKNSSISLTKLFTELYDIISKLTVSTPNGPSGTPLPPTITSLEKFKTDFQTLLK